MPKVRMAMIGAGRAAESLHLPAAAYCSGVETTVVVDRDLERARRVADAYGVREVRASAGEIAGLADAAVVALPHHLHAPVARELLTAGVHTLVEKPLALTAGECDELTKIARQRGLVLAVGMVRRLFPAARFVSEALAGGVLGRIERVVAREGYPFSWQVASDFTFRPDTGGGVLADTGVHLFDLLGWWFGELEVQACRDDSFGGVDAECEVELATRNGVPIRVEMSRTRTLPGTVVITGEKGSLEAATGFEPRVTLSLDAGRLSGEAALGERRYHNVRELFIEQLEAFVGAVQGDGWPVVDGADATPAVRLLERCRSVRQPLVLPWLDADGRVAA